MNNKKYVMDDEIKVQEEQPQIIAEIKINDISAQERNRLLAEEYNSCELCGTELIFSHVSNFSMLEVDEEAYCPHCRISTITQTHKLQ